MPCTWFSSCLGFAAARSPHCTGKAIPYNLAPTESSRFHSRASFDVDANDDFWDVSFVAPQTRAGGTAGCGAKTRGAQTRQSPLEKSPRHGCRAQPKRNNDRGNPSRHVIKQKSTQKIKSTAQRISRLKNHLGCFGRGGSGTPNIPSAICRSDVSGLPPRKNTKGKTKEKQSENKWKNKGKTQRGTKRKNKRKEKRRKTAPLKKHMGNKGKTKGNQRGKQRENTKGNQREKQMEITKGKQREKQMEQRTEKEREQTKHR